MYFSRICPILLVLLLTSGSIVRSDESGELIDLLIGFLQDSDKETRSLAFEQIRSAAKGEAATKIFSDQLPSLSPEAQVGLLSALSDRGDSAAQPAVLSILNVSKEPTVRVAAIKALGSLGGENDLNLLVSLLDKGTSDEQVAAKSSLIRLGDSSVVNELATRLASSSSSLKIKLIDVLTTRRARNSIPAILSSALDTDEKVRRAAMDSLGKIAEPNHFSGMVQGVLAAENSSERAAAEKAIMFVCSRVENKDDRADELILAIGKLSTNDYMTMLSTLGRVGGSKALTAVETAIVNRNAAMHSAGVRAITNWPDASAAPKLIELAKSDKHQDHQISALRALIRISPLPDGRSDSEKLDLLKTAMSMCTRDADRTLAIRRASAIRLVETLRFVVPYLDKKAFTQQACETIVELAHHRGLREPHDAEFHKALDRVIQQSKDSVVIDRAKRYKNDQTWVRPKK